jgi:hypothetical protein
VVDDQRGGTASDRVRPEIMAVAAETADAEEEVTRTHRAVVVGQPGYVDRGSPWKQFIQIHRRLRVAACYGVLGVAESIAEAGHAFGGHGSIPKCGTAQPTIFWNAGAATEPP